MGAIALQARQEIIKLHNGIITAARRSVSDAVKIGQILADQKEELKGKYVEWIESMPFDDNTAYRYIKLYSYANKIPTVGNLQEAYRQVETLEAQERRTEDERKRDLITQYIKTGKKPDGWDRSLDYAYKKKIEEDRAYEERRDKHIEEKSKTTTGQTNQEWLNDFNSKNDILTEAATHIIKKEKEREEWKEKIRISHTGKDDSFLDAVMDYLDTLDDDNRRIEACTNIIKICKNISQQLQQVK